MFMKYASRNILFSSNKSCRKRWAKIFPLRLATLGFAYLKWKSNSVHKLIQYLQKHKQKYCYPECETEWHSVNRQSSIDLKWVADLHGTSPLPKRKSSSVFLKDQMLSTASERLNSLLTTIVKISFASFPLQPHMTKSSTHWGSNCLFCELCTRAVFGWVFFSFCLQCASLFPHLW